ncbi:MAG: transposase [Nitrosomonas sp.]
MIKSVAAKIGCTAETLRTWVRGMETDQGIRTDMSTADLERLKELERKNRELKRANEILRKASAYFAKECSVADRNNGTFVKSHKAEYAVKPISNAIWIAPSSYYEHKARARYRSIA